MLAILSSLAASLVRVSLTSFSGARSTNLGVGQLVAEHIGFFLGLFQLLMQALEFLFAVDQLHHGDKAAGGRGNNGHNAIGGASVLFGQGNIRCKGKACQVSAAFLEGCRVAVSMVMLVFLAGCTFISLRMVRTA